MQILVTGGAGYVGSVLTPQLLAEGYRVRVLDNFLFGQTSLLHCCSNPNLEIIRGDVRNEETLKRALVGVDFIIHLAAIVGATLCDRDPWAAYETNVDAVNSLLLLRDRDQGIIFPCTNSGYGIGEAGVYCTEETPLRPVSLYGKLKVQAEAKILNNGKAVSLRLATVFGASPRMRLDLLVNDFVLRAMRDGYIVLYQADFKRNYIHIEDVASAFLHCIKHWNKMKNQIYNVGLSEANLSKWELCQEIKKQIPDFYFVEAEVGEDPDKRNYIVSNAKLEATGWGPAYSLQDGIAELIKAYQVLG